MLSAERKSGADGIRQRIFCGQSKENPIFATDFQKKINKSWL
ncbi:hypothetical protein PRABACTJOHN_03653 [Parabacteroides johnsonii DSM 18315]|uniref:Uncharacterized protein n=1 Tax=Parabacteroides johnsonii DSM 18315 TaxID=537006 RepID=B7BF24_9BACT|nr:hypothetical protein PRABACTJOHN_03653 [Parabacteroides johnsonii DSM 18315]